MATKKIKKALKKVSPTRRVTPKPHHHWHPHDFLIVVLGGVVVIFLIFLLSDSFRTKVHEYTGIPSKQIEQMPVENANEKTIHIKEFTYTGDPLKIKKGTTVTWTNDDLETHSATADDGSFNTGLLEQGESGSVTFNEVGSHAYHCSMHPNMTGTVIVQE